MHGQSRRGDRRSGIFLDMAYLILGIAIVILAVLSFINPEGNHMLFVENSRSIGERTSDFRQDKDQSRSYYRRDQ